MSDAEHGHFFADVVKAHRDRHTQDELAEDSDDVDFDLGRDIAQPSIPESPVDFDLAKDIGAGNEPPELRGN